MRLILADDSVLFREGLARLLADAGLEVVAQAGDAVGLMEATGRLLPDLVIVDIRMPPSHTNEGLLAAIEIRALHPRTGVLVLSHHVESEHALRLLASGGGVGYLLKDRVIDLGEFVASLEVLAGGGSVVDPSLVAQLVGRPRPLIKELTEREAEVLALMAEGRSNQAIGQRLFLGAKTVETHVRNIFSKLDLLPAGDDHRRVLAVLTYLRSSQPS